MQTLSFIASGVSRAVIEGRGGGGVYSNIRVPLAQGMGYLGSQRMFCNKQRRNYSVNWVGVGGVYSYIRVLRDEGTNIQKICT